MLKRLLRILADGRPRSPEEMAGLLDVSPALVRQMVEDLARRGYLSECGPADSRPGGRCAGCPGAAACAPAIRKWTRSEKGRRLPRKG